ncbi:MAG: hypothetical protein KBC62_00615 [Candidatus Pacebacteria bacterium]|nr:hypothetical protein [Candidatus Paceibacterota bacterium]
MPKDELVTYITSALEKGKQLDEIVSNLLAAGWKEEDISLAIDYVLPPEPDISVPTPSQTTQKGKVINKQNFGRTALLGGLLQMIFGGFSLPSGFVMVMYGLGIIPVGIFIITLWSGYKSYKHEDKTRQNQALIGVILSLCMILLHTMYGKQMFDISIIGLIVN